MDSPNHYQKTVHFLRYVATLEYIFQFKESHPLQFALFLPLIIPGCSFMAMLACLIVFEAISILSLWGVNFLMFALPLMLQVSGHLSLVIALVSISYLIYKAILQICRSFDIQPWTSRTVLTHIMWLIYDECYIVLHICGLVTYALLHSVLSYLPSMLVLTTWFCLKLTKQVISITFLVYERRFWASDKDQQLRCCKKTNIFPVSPDGEEIQKSKKMGEVMEASEQQQLTDEATTEPRDETSQQAIRKKTIESIRRSILTTNLTKENVKDMWLKKQQSRRGRRRWSRLSNNALSVNVSRMSKDW